MRAPVAVLALVAGLLAVAQPAPAQSPGITVDPGPPDVTTVTLYYGRTFTYTVVLNTQPTTDVTVRISPDIDVTPHVTADTDPDTPGDQNVLTFSPSNWSTTQTVTITGGRTGAGGLRNFKHVASGNDPDYQGTLADRSAIFILAEFDGSVNVGTGGGSVPVPEGGFAYVYVGLDKPPVGDVTVTVMRRAGRDQDMIPDTDASTPGDQNTLTFTTLNWFTRQLVIVRGREDDDADNGKGNIDFTANGGDYVNKTNSQLVVEVDNDSRALILTPPSVTVRETSTATYTVKLASRPTTDVTVTVARNQDGDDDLTAAPDTLTFTPGDWSTAQTVTLTAAFDVDTTSGTATFVHTASSGDDYDGESRGLIAKELDIHTPGQGFTPLNVTVPEGSTVTYAVSIGSTPTANVTITVARTTGDTSVTVDADPNTPGIQNTLTFTPTNYAAAQTVAVGAAEDDDAADGTATITHTATGGNYAGLARTTTATEDDNDFARLILDPARVTVAEGSTATFTVRLGTRPAGAVTVRLFAQGDADLTADTDLTTSGDQHTLTFSVAGWSTPQTVTVAAVPDADGVDGSATWNVDPTAGYDDAATLTVVAIEADDDRALLLAPRDVAVVEGSTVTYTVRLATQPNAPVTVTVARSAGDADLTVDTDPNTAGNQDTLTFSVAGWSTSQTVTVAAAADADGFDDSATFSHAAAGGQHDGVTAALTATAADGDRAVRVAPPSLALTEGGSSASYTVTLATTPTAAVTVTVSSGDAEAVTAAPTTLNFTTTTWNTSQTVVLTPVADADGEDERVAITNTAAGGGYGESASVTATVADSDTKKVLLSTNRVALTEGGSTGSYTVRLSTRPTTAVTVTVSNSDAGAVTAAPDTLTFTTTTWSTSQTVVLTPEEDGDGRDESVAISHTAANGGYGAVTVAGVTAAVADDDRAVRVFPDSLALTEGGSSASYTVTLATTPTAAVTVTVSSGDADAVSAAPTTLNFTTTTWNTSQTVVLTPVADLDGEDETVAIGNTAAGGGYGESAAVTATVADSDTKQVLLSTTRVALTEGGSTGSYTVRLTAAPTTTVTVTVDSGDAGAVTAAPDTLTFTTATWSTSQTVVLTPEEDGDGHDESVAISHAAANGGYGAVTVADVTATVADDDRAVRVFPDSLALTEGGSSASYTVTLATTPTAAVTVTVSSGDAGAVSAAPTTLDFTTSTWSTSQTVVLTPVADLDGEDETVAIGNTAAGGGYGESAAVTATVADSDTKQVLLSTTRVALTEGGSTGSYTVRLTAAPTTTVTVTVDSGDAGAVTAAPDTLTFTTSTWSTSQTVVLTPEEDADGHDESVAISHSAAEGGYGSVTVAGVTATVADDDRVVLVFPDAITLNEGGSSATYTVRLASAPTTDVTVAVNNGDAGAVTASPASLTFTTTTWNTSQTVVLTPVDDLDGENELVMIFNHPFGGGYRELTAVTVAVIDSSVKEVLLSTTRVALTEGGSTASYTVRLTARPTTDVTVTVGSGDPYAVAASPALLTFTTTTWNTSQTVTLTPVADDDGYDESVAVSHTAADGGYGSVTVADVTATVADDDRAVFVFPDSLALTEGGSSVSYTVTLATTPTAAVTVTVASRDNDALATAPRSLTFTTTTWNTSQTVVLTAVADDDGEHESVVIDNAATGGGYRESATVTATVTDDDPKRVRVAPRNVALTEGSSTGSYTVRLTTRPTTTVTVSVRSSDADAVTVAPDTLNFTTTTWSTSQTVVLTPKEDADGHDESVAISHAAADGGYGAVTVADVTAAVADDDRAVLVFPDTLALTEGGSSASYTVTLATTPTAAVTVTVSSGDAGAVSAAPITLNFTTTTWSTSQTVVLTPVADLDGEDETVAIGNTAAGGGYGESAAVTATVADSDTKQVLLSTTRVALTEGGSTGSYTVRLSTEPTTAVTVTVSNGDAGAVTARPGHADLHHRPPGARRRTVVLTPGGRRRRPRRERGDQPHGGERRLRRGYRRRTSPQRWPTTTARCACSRTRSRSPRAARRPATR